LYTHHFRKVDESRGFLLGAASDLQAKRVCELVTGTGQQIDYQSFPTMPHSMHGTDPKLFTELLVEFASRLEGGSLARPLVRSHSTSASDKPSTIR